MMPSCSLVAPRNAGEAQFVAHSPSIKRFRPILSGCPLMGLPDELKGRILQFAGDPCASRVSRAFRSLNQSELLVAWHELESLMTDPTNPLYPHYAEVIDAHPIADWFSRAEALYEKISQELRILAPFSFYRLTPMKRTFDPTYYIEAAKVLKESNDRSLERMWEEVREQIVALNLSEEQEANLPDVNASADAICTWLQNNPLLVEAFEELELNDLELSVIPREISHFTNLRNLDLSSNEIYGILPKTFDQLIHLRKVSLSENQIKQLPSALFRNNKKIVKVDFQRNYLRSLPADLFSECFRLKVVNFNHNLIEEIPECLFNDCFGLKVVHLRYNQLVSVPESLFVTNNYLQDLDLSENLISRFSRIHLSRCPRLWNFYLSNNKITVIDEDWFSDCLILRRIALDRNAIQFVVNDFCINCQEIITAAFDINPMLTNPEWAFGFNQRIIAAYLESKAGN